MKSRTHFLQTPLASRVSMDLDYTDGAEIESQIESLLTDATDLRSITSIAHSRYHDWPVRYHLCPERANLLRHLNFAQSTVLELGAGMGAVSRYLAENALALTVVEGTEQRFRALSERLRDLTNWTGQVSNLMDVSFQDPFDVVVVVGALEYSELYVKTVLTGESPFEAFLRKAKSFLKKDGVLVLAIENQLGLKYFSGAPEDHTSHPYDGISGYSKEKTPKTFSRKTLLQLFEKTGFHSCQEYYPFPDYKTPTAVLTPTVSLIEPNLAANLATHAPWSMDALHWNSLLGAISVAEAGLLPDLSNSFLIVACENPDSEIFRRLLPPANQVAWHYSMNRRVPTCTKFLRDQNRVITQKNELAAPFQSPTVRWTPTPLEPVKRGLPVRETILRAAYFEGFEAWFTLFSDYVGWALNRFKSAPGFVTPEAIDALYTNAVQSGGPKDYELFDQEWTLAEPMPTSWFVFRNVLALFHDLPSLTSPSKLNTLAQLYQRLCVLHAIEPRIERDIDLESSFQSSITPEDSPSKFVDALKARVKIPVHCALRRQSSLEITVFRQRLASIVDQFPDFLSAMDRPSTRFFLSLDGKLRASRIFRFLFNSGKDFAKSIYRLLPTQYKVHAIEKTSDGKDITTFKRTFGALPKMGWTLIKIETTNENRPLPSFTVRLEIKGQPFSLSVPRVKNSYRRIFRLHESAQALSILSDTKDDFTVQSLQTRNLLKAEVVLQTVFPQLASGFPWRKERERALAFWKQGKLRGLIAYVHTLVKKADIGIVESYSDWTEKFDTLNEKDRSQVRAHVQDLEYKPKISILMPVYNTDPKWLERTIASVESQLYPHWELCIADDASTELGTRNLLQSCQSRDPRIKIVHREENGHISEASNSALEIATGEFVALLDHDDELSETALYHVVYELNKDRELQFLYSDEDKLDIHNRRFLPHFKTDWNPELFYSYNLITHFAVIKSELVKSVGAFRKGFEGSQDYDLFLRCSERLAPRQIRHIPHILYHWRVVDSSTSGHIAAKPYAKEAALKALNEHLTRRNTKAHVVQGYNDCFRIQYTLPEPPPLVSIIICTRDRADLLRTVIGGLEKNTEYDDIEIIIVNNHSTEKATLSYLAELGDRDNIRIIDYNQGFNFAAMNNLAAKVASGEILAFLNNDLKITKSDWLKEMVSFAIQSHVGAVGAKLIYPSGRLQHGGVILGIGGVAGHSHKGLGPHQNDFYARTHVSQCVSAVTAACMVVRKSVFDQVNGFDDAHLSVAFNDVDFCLKLRETGYSNVWTPYAELVHFESESRGSDQRPENFSRFQREETYMKEKWGNILQTDPFYNPNLTLQRENFDYAYPPRVEKPWKKPNKQPAPLRNS